MRRSDARYEVFSGRATSLGATAGPSGTNFAVSSGGDEVTLCLFDAEGAEERLVMPERDGDVFHGFVAGVGPGQLYGIPGQPGPSIRRTARVTTLPSCCSTRTLAQSTARSGSDPKCSGTHG